MSSDFCSSCLLQPFTLFSTGLVALMAKVVGISLLSITAFTFCLYVTFRVILSLNSGPVELVGYPDSDNSRDQFGPANFTISESCRPPLRTYGKYILNVDGSRCKLVSTNWYGASDEFYVPGGLDIRHRDDIAATIRGLGFNSVRLPYADELVAKNPIISSEHLTANADLEGATALEVYEAVVKSLTKAGLAVVINNHITKARWCCDGNLCDAKWKNDYLGPFCPVKQTEEQWIVNLETVSRPHVDDPLVIGIDLRNEIRGPWNGFLWNSWATAAEEASERLHLLQPDWLMFVEGVCSSNDLTRVKQRPVVLSTPHKVVYSAHVYGWSGWGQMRPYWNRDYNSFAGAMNKNWGYLIHQDLAPVWIGEIGAPQRPNKGDMNYWKNLVRYLKDMDADFAYWAINPRKPHNNESEGYSLLHDDWETPWSDYRMYDISQMAVMKSGPLGSQKVMEEELFGQQIDTDLSAAGNTDLLSYRRPTRMQQILQDQH